MPHLHRSTSFRAIALLSMAAMLLSACTSWQPISLESGAVPNNVRITTEGERVVLRDARLVGDTAVAGRWMVTHNITPPRSIRLTDIQLMERRQTHVYRTVGLTAGFLAVAFAVAVAAAVDVGPLQLRRAR